MSSSKNVSLLELFLYFFRLSWTAFGGPLAYISMMEDDCVEKRGWLSKEEFTEMVGITNMLPGPNSVEMAIHIGYVKRGLAGGILSGFAFVTPSFIIILFLSWLYFQYHTMPAVGDIFYGINPVVVAIILATAYRLGRSSIVDWKLFFIFIAAFLVSYLTEVNEAIILLVAGLTGIILYTPKLVHALVKDYKKLNFLIPSIVLFNLSTEYMPTLLFVFLEFLKAGCLLFGSGLVIIPLIGPDVISFGWVSEKEFFDGVTLGQITPGPVMKTAAFIGYKVAGVPGALIAFLGVYLPPFIIVPVVSSSFRKVKDNVLLKNFLKGISAAVVGTIFAVVISLSKVAFVDYITLLIAVICLILVIKFKVNLSLLVIGAGVLGLIIKSLFL